MRMEWDDDPHAPWPLPAPLIEETDTTAPTEGVQRLDFLLPNDAEYGVVAASALQLYLDVMLQMVARHGQTLTVLHVALDPSSLLSFLGPEGHDLIGRAVARCLRQETRGYDVVGRAPNEDLEAAADFVIVCPLLTEEMGAGLAHRMLNAATSYAADPAHPWPTLSIGVAALSLDTQKGEALLVRAREAMRRARRAGGGQVWRHSDTLRALSQDE